MIIGVTGANGFIGSHLVHSLGLQGHRVRALVRKSGDLRWLEGESPDYYFGDIRDAASLPPFLEGLDILIHCATLLAAPNRRVMMETNALGTRTLMAAVAASCPGLRRFVFISSQEVAGVRYPEDPVLTEDESVVPASDYGYSKLRAEKIILSYSQKIPVSILRPGPVYGPRDKATFPLFQAAARRIRPVMCFPNTLSILYVQNLIEAIVACMDHPRTVGRVYYVNDGSFMTWGRLFDTLEQNFGRAVLKVPISRPMIKAAGIMASFWTMMGGKPGIVNRHKARILSSTNLFASTENARRDFAFSPSTETSEGIRETALWYRENRWL